MKRHALSAFCVVLLGLAADRAAALPPSVRFLTISDITPRSFRVVWLAGEPSTPAVRLYEAPACTTEILGTEVTPFPSIDGGAPLATAAQQKGVMVVQVSGLAPDTQYCVRTMTTSLLSTEQTLAPPAPLLVRTESRTTRARPLAPGDPAMAFGNDLTKLAITRTNPSAATRGALVVVAVAGASAPLSAFVGDGIDDDGNPETPTTLALVNMNNLYSASTHESLDLLGNGAERLSARVLGGPEGFVTVHARLVPNDGGRSEVTVPAPCPMAGRNPVDCDGRLGDTNGDGSVTPADAAAISAFVVGGLPLLRCPVCADATWDFTNDMKDALAIGQAAAGLRGLPW